MSFGHAPPEYPLLHYSSLYSDYPLNFNVLEIRALEHWDPECSRLGKSVPGLRKLENPSRMGKKIRYIRWDCAVWVILFRQFSLPVEVWLSVTLEKSPQVMDALGRHVLIELWDCNPGINQPECVRAAICQGVKEIGATLLHLYVHEFSPQGVTGVATLAESHLALHSWPEHGYLAADVFTCGDQVDPLALVGVLKEWFQPGFVEVKELERGCRPQVVPCRSETSEGSVEIT